MISAALAGMAGPMIFELPFDLIVMARTYPPIPPHPAFYRFAFFAPLFLIEITTLALLMWSPMVRLSRATFVAYALMLAVFAVWALSGFEYPATPVPYALNVVSKLLAFATILTLFLPLRAQAQAVDPHAGRAQVSGAGPSGWPSWCRMICLSRSSPSPGRCATSSSPRFSMAPRPRRPAWSRTTSTRARRCPTPGSGRRWSTPRATRIAVIELTAVRVIRLADVDLAHALGEGEGYTTVAEWRTGHEEFWHSAEMRAALDDPDFTVDDDTLLVAEEFRLV